MAFCLLVFVFSLPFWILGGVAVSAGQDMPVQLPASALMAFCPALAALVLIRRENPLDGVRRLLRRAFDLRRVPRRRWYAPALLLMPLAMVVSYAVLRLSGTPLPQPRPSAGAVILLVVALFLAAIGEEIGWMAYAADPLQRRWNALAASLLLGGVWALWHVVPWLQANHDLPWIAWQSLFTVVSRVLIFWLYNNAGHSVFVAALFHTSSNVSVFLFPDYGSHYNPALAAAILGVIAVAVMFLWTPGRLDRFRYHRNDGAGAAGP